MLQVLPVTVLPIAKGSKFKDAENNENDDLHFLWPTFPGNEEMRQVCYALAMKKNAEVDQEIRKEK